jgi:hypothetical protein
MENHKKDVRIVPTFEIDIALDVGDDKWFYVIIVHAILIIFNIIEIFRIWDFLIF